VWGAGMPSGNQGHHRSSTIQRVYAFGWSGSAPATGTSSIAASKMEVVIDGWDLHRFGHGCKGSNGKAPALSFTGSAKIGGSGYGVNLANALPNARTFLIIGLPRHKPPVDLTIFGAPGCVWYEPDVFLLGLTCNSLGLAGVNLTVPRTVPACLRVWFQWAPFDRTANALGLTFSNNGRLLAGN